MISLREVFGDQLVADELTIFLATNPEATRINETTVMWTVGNHHFVLVRKGREFHGYINRPHNTEMPTRFGLTGLSDLSSVVIQLSASYISEPK